MTDPAQAWWQIEIEDDSALSGAATARLLGLVAGEAKLSYAIAYSIEGAGPTLAELQAGVGSVMLIEKLLPAVESMAQFDWGDFFLTENELDAKRIVADEDYPDSLRKCSAMIRAVDDTYFYVYGRQPALRAALEQAFPGSPCRAGEPEQLDYPE